MLDGRQHAVLTAGADVFPRAGKDRFRVGAVGADVRDGVPPVEVDIHHRREGKVAADGLPFLRADLTQFTGVFRAARCSHLHLLPVGRAACRDPVATGFQVGCREHRDLRSLLHVVVGTGDLRRISRPEHQPAGMLIQYGVIQIPRIRRVADREKELPDLLFLRHAFLCFLQEGFFLCRQAKRLRTQ